MALHTSRKRTIGLALLLGILLSPFINTPTSYALSGSQFSAGNIMDDSVFFNSSSMTTNEIQVFLNSKVPSCDTNGTQRHSSGMTRAQYGAANGQPAPYVCMRDYTQNVPSVGQDSTLCSAMAAGTKSAAIIIHDVSVACGVNPQVLITLLQKEQSLITDDWPWSTQYRSATGYGCPDTAACDSTYYGFFNQVYNAAKAFKRYARDAGDFNYRAGRNNSILYNPNSSCGSSSIFLQSQATAGLYIYTPYQPNQAALNNLYGTGDSCSAYGNRNFWRMFNDWFGPTVGPLIRTASSGELFYSDGITKYRVGSMYLANEYGLGLSSVRIVSQQVMDSLALSTSPQYLTYVIKSNSDSDEDGGSIYLVSGGKRYQFTSMTQLADFGFTVQDISYLDYTQLLRMPLQSNLSSFVKSSYGGYVFKIEGGKRRGILDLATLTSLNPGTVQEMNDFIVGNIPRGQSIITGPLVLKDPGNGIWIVENSTWHYVSSMSAYNCLGLGSMPTIAYSTYQTDVGTQGADSACVVQTATGGQRFIMDNWRRIPVDPAWGFTSFVTLPDSFVNRLPVYNPTAKPVFRTAANAPLYIFDAGKKRQIYSMSSFSQRGYVNNDLFTSSSDFLSTIPGGTLALADGSIIQDNSNGKLYVLANDNRYYIPSMSLFNSYGYSTSAIMSMSPAAIAGYADLGTLASQLAYAGSATVFDSGIALRVPQPLELAYGFNGGNKPTYLAGVAASGSVRTGTRYLKFGGSGQLYYLENGTKRPVYSWDVFVGLGGSNSNITGLSSSAAGLFPTGSPML
jgi:hypothetical protein